MFYLKIIIYIMYIQFPLLMFYVFLYILYLTTNLTTGGDIQLLEKLLEKQCCIKLLI